MEQVTLEKLQKFGSVSQAIEWAQNQYDTYPKLPAKPILLAKHTSEDVSKYQKDLHEFEKAYDNHKIEKEKYNTNSNNINNLIVQFIKQEAGLDTIPEQYRDKVYSKAYEDGHSSGYYEIYLNLNSLLEIFD